MSNTLRIYQAPSGQWSGQLLDEDGIDLAGIAGCDTAEDVECEAQAAGMVYASAMYENHLDTIKSMLVLCKAKGLDDAVRLLDKSELMDQPWGSECTLQVIDCVTGKWLQCTPDGKAIYSLSHWNELIRADLAWAGPVRLAVAAR